MSSDPDMVALAATRGMSCEWRSDRGCSAGKPAGFRGGGDRTGGEGDYCRAYSVEQAWIFLVARHAEAARSLTRAAALLPILASTVSLPIPVVAYSGRTGVGGHAFVGYRKVSGIEL